MENFTLAFLVKELQQILGGSFLEKIQQVGQAQLRLRFGRRRLLLSADTQHPTIRLLQPSHQYARQTASHFTLQARKHLAGGELDGLEQVAADRIVRLRLIIRDQSRQGRAASLVAELIPRRANLYLLDAADRIIARLIARPHDHRIRGQQYVVPEPAGSIDFARLTEAQLGNLLKQTPALDQALARNVIGFSPLMSSEVAHRAKQLGAYAAFQSLVQQLQAPQPEPCIYAPAPLDQIREGAIDWQRQLLLSPIRLHWPSKEAGFVPTEFASMLEALEAYEQRVEVIRQFQAKTRILATELRRRAKKLQKRRGRLQEEMKQLTEVEQDRRFGQLLLGNVQRAERGAEGYIVTDYYHPDQKRREIPAARHQTPQQAAKMYFDRYRKNKRKAAAIEQQINGVQQEIAELDELANQLKAATRMEDLAPLAQALEVSVPVRGQRMKGKQRTVEKIPGISRFQSSDDHEILVGRSAEANQRLTFKLARPHDIWLHAADYPGSHVVLRKDKKEPIPFGGLTQAAQCAAFYSQARQQAKAVVRYTERKYVHKIRGAPPGLVRLAEFKSITVEPRVEAARTDI